MNLTQAKMTIKMAWRLNQRARINTMPIFTLVGDTGIGKSSIVEEVATELAAEGCTYFQTKFLAQIEVGDLIGMPDKDVKAKKTIWLAPEWWPSEKDKGILFFDELADARTDVRNAIMPMLLTRKLHQHILPKDILIICAMNPIGGDFGGNEFTRQFKDRIAFIKVETTDEETLRFFETNNFPLYAKNMIAEQPDLFSDAALKAHIDTNWVASSYYDGSPSRRAVSTAIQVYEEMTPAERSIIGQEVLTAIAGPVIAAQIITYQKRSSAELLDPSKLFKEDSIEETIDTVAKWIDDNRVEKVNSFVKMVCAHIKSKGLGKEKIPAMIEFLVILPEDIAINLLRFINVNLKNSKSILIQFAQDARIFDKIQRLQTTNTTSMLGG